MSPKGISIIGGGMVGASLALLLTKALPTIPIRLFESTRLLTGDSASSGETDASARIPAWDGRSTALSPTAVTLFRALGLWSELAEFATAIERIHVSDQGSWGLSQFTQQDNQQQPLGQVVENSGMQRVLHQALKRSSAIEVISAAQVTALRPCKGGVRLGWRSSQLIAPNSMAPVEEHKDSAALVVLADGADSPLRKSLGIAVREVPYEQTALVANVRFSLPHGGCAFERFCPAGPLAILPRGQSSQERVGALVWTFARTQQAAFEALSDEQLLAQLQTAFGYRLGRFEAIGQRQFYPLRLVVAKEQVRSHLVLQGNAAHFLHPVAGQGFNLALRDGLRLAEVLSEGAASGDALGELAQLQRYARAAEADQTRTIALSDGFNRVFSRREPGVRWGRDLGMLLLETVPQFRQVFIRQLSGQAQPVSYPRELNGPRELNSGV
ncbi:MAG TPA: FAD-dependent monooxygenase [Cellvibrionaceae bacterium]